MIHYGVVALINDLIVVLRFVDFVITIIVVFVDIVVVVVNDDDVFYYYYCSWYS